MLFRKNKIDQGIKDNAANVSGDFETLDKVQAKLKKNKLATKLFVNPYKSFLADCKYKKTATINYFKVNAFNLMRMGFFSLVLFCFIYTLVLLFLPYYGANVGDFFTKVNNFYTAALINNNIVYSLTPAAIAYIVLVIPSLAAIGWYIFKESKTVNKLLIQTTKQTKWVSISIYIVCFVAFLLIFILILIPPSINALKSFQDATNNMAILTAGKDATDPAIQASVLVAMNNIYKIYGLEAPSLINDANAAFQLKISQFYADYTRGLFFLPNTISNYSIIFNVSTASPATLSTAGIIIISFLSVFAATVLIALPCTNLGLNIKHAFKQETLDLENRTPTNFVLSIYVFFKNINWKVPGKQKVEKPKKATYSKYKRELKETGFAKGDETSFASSQLDNSIIGMISKEEIESHEANKAFLNPNGEWMYHDGQGHYFVAKNDIWVNYDINQAVHRSNVDKVNELGLSPSKKVAKKGWFNAAPKNPKQKSKNSEVALPDDDLDEILKKLDI